MIKLIRGSNISISEHSVCRSRAVSVCSQILSLERVKNCGAVSHGWSYLGSSTDDAVTVMFLDSVYFIKAKDIDSITNV